MLHLASNCHITNMSMGNNMRQIIRFLLSTLLALHLQNVSADIFNPSHSCSKPYKPYKFNSEWEVESFKNDVERYKSCISDFVEEQNNAVRYHSDAAEEAIEEWNNFVNLELN